MNNRNTILEIIRHPVIKRILETKMATKSEVTRLVAMEVMNNKNLVREFDKNKNYLEQLTKILKTYRDIYDTINDEIKSQGDKLVQDIDTLKTLADMLMQIKESTKSFDKGVKRFFKTKEWNKASDQAILGITQSIKQLNRFINDPEKNAKSILDSLKAFLKFYEYGVSIVKFSSEKPQDREKLIKSLLGAKDITEFINIYRQLAGDQYKEQLEQTIKVIRTLAALKKKKPDLQPGDKNMENILRSEWTAKKAFMDLEKIADRIKAKIVELITGIEGDAEKTGPKPPFDKMLMALRKAGNMKDKLEIVRVRFPQYMTPDYGLTTLDNLNDYKDLFMAVVKGKTTELDEAKSPQIQGTSKESRQFLIGIVAYYKLAEKESYEKIKADDKRFKKELARIMKAADHMESFNKPLADALRKFVKDLDKEDCVALLKKLIEMFTSKYKLDEKAFAELTVKLLDIFMVGNKPKSDEEKKNVVEKFNSTLKPFIEEFSSKIDKFVKMYKDNTDECKQKVDNLQKTDVPKYKIAMFFINYREILEKIGTPAPPSAPTPETIELGKKAIKNYIDAYDAFCTKFLNVKTLHAQSELFRLFYATIFPIAGINADTIVGEQISAYTETAMPDLKITNEGLLEDEGERKLTKDIAQNAKVVERHANAILEILDGYEKYLNIGSKKEGGVEQGSRELFNKFGESDPKKLINKFVKLIVKDINGTIEVADQIIAQANAASAEPEKPETEQPEAEETEGEEEPAKRDDLLSEAPVDNSVRDLPTREKIILVVKTGKKVCEIGARLKDMIAKEKREGGEETEATQSDSPPPAAEIGAPPGKRDDIQEAETMASDARNNPDATGTDKSPGDLRDMEARVGDEINIGYKNMAEEMHGLLTKIRPLFPTSQPFDTNYDFSVAKSAFKAALKGLSSHVAQVSGFEFDQVTSKEVLTSFKVKLEGFSKVIKDVFGFSEELKQAEEQASFNDEGEKTDMPHPDQSTKKEDDAKSKSPEELKSDIEKALKESESTIEILRYIAAYPQVPDAKRNSEFFKYVQSTSGFIRSLNMSMIRGSNKDVFKTLQRSEEPIEGEALKFVKGDSLKANLKSLMEKIARIYFNFIKTTTQDIREAIVIESQDSRISEVGEDIIKFIAIYNVLDILNKELVRPENTEELNLTDKKNKEIQEMIKDLARIFTQIQTTIKQYPVKNVGKNVKVEEFYEDFHFKKFQSFGLTNDDLINNTGAFKPKDDKPESGKGDEPEAGGDEGGRRRPPEDTETEKEETGPSRRRQAARRQRATNENILANRLKPLIREMLNKGK